MQRALQARTGQRRFEARTGQRRFDLLEIDRLDRSSARAARVAMALAQAASTLFPSKARAACSDRVRRRRAFGWVAVTFRLG